MAAQVNRATITNGPGFQTLKLDGVDFPYVLKQPITVMTSEDNPDIDYVLVTIPTLGKVTYE